MAAAGTIPPTHPVPAINPAAAAEDADILHKAMKGLGTNDQKLVDILCHRSNEQLAEIGKAFETKFAKSLVEFIRTETSGQYRKLLLSLTTPRHVYFAKSIHKAVARLGTDDGALIDILCFATNNEIKQTINTYHNLYKKDLIDDVKDDTSGNYRRVLKALLRGTREETPFDPNVQQHSVEKDAQDLYKKGEGRLGTDDKYFVTFFTSHSEAYIQAVNKVYEAKHKHGLVEAIKKETSGEYERVLKALATPRAAYFAERLHHAVDGLGTKDRNLRRIFTMNNKAQLREIATQYQNIFKKAASADIKGDTSGWYNKTLQALLN